MNAVLWKVTNNEDVDASIDNNCYGERCQEATVGELEHSAKMMSKNSRERGETIQLFIRDSKGNILHYYTEEGKQY